MAPSQHIYTRDMVESWRHAVACEQHRDKSQCICGLTALQGQADRAHRAFAIQTVPLVAPTSAVEGPR